MKVYNVKTSSGQDEWKANRVEAIGVAAAGNGTVDEYQFVERVFPFPPLTKEEADELTKRAT
jgi:hypothetical protein